MELRVGISQAAIEQWGLGNPSINFPIAFPKECFIAAITRAAGNYEHSIVITTKNKTNLSWICKGYDNSAGNTYANWLALGCQLQWGFTVFDPAYYKNVNFTLPLSVNGTFCAFSTGYDAKGSTFLWHSMSHFNNVNVGVTGFVFDSRYTFTGLGYLAVCWQKQWGMNIHGWVIFPIPFTKFRRLVTNHQGNVFMDSKARESNTLSGFTLDVADNSDQNKDAQWIAIGA